MAYDLKNDYRKLFFRLSEFYSGISIITPDGRDSYQVDNDGCVRCEGRIFCDVQDPDPFPEGSVATMPSGAVCTKKANIWIASPPIKVPTPVVVSGVVPGHEEYQLIEQVPYSADEVRTPFRVEFYLPLPDAETANFATAADSVDFPDIGCDADDNGEPTITIVTEVREVPQSSNQLTINSARPPVTKGALAKRIAREVKRYFGFVEGEDNCLRTFVDVTSGNEVTFEDLFLVDLVEVSKGTFQPTIALRALPQV